MSEEAKRLQSLWNGWFSSHFYPSYPRHIARADAFKAWSRLCPKNATYPELCQICNQILALLELRISETWVGREQKFIPYPGTWLRQEVWIDQPKNSSARTPAGQRKSAAILPWPTTKASNDGQK